MCVCVFVGFFGVYFRVSGAGFWVSGLIYWGSASRVQGLGFSCWLCFFWSFGFTVEAVDSGRFSVCEVWV